MRIRSIILIIISAMLIIPTGIQAQYDNLDRQPFSEPAYRPVDPPGNEFTGAANQGAGILRAEPGEPPPGGDEGGGGFVGAPVSDALWLILLLAVGYGIVRRRTLGSADFPGDPY